MTEIRVHYPRLQVSQMKLATDFDHWRPFDYKVRFDTQDSETPCYVFLVDHDMPFFFKPVLQLPNGELQWSVGQDYVAPGQTNIYPYFDATAAGQVHELRPFPHGNHSHDVWLYLPPGYQDNQLKRYPLLVVHDGQNMFRKGWDLQNALETLMDGQVIDKMVVLAVANAGPRMAEYGNDFEDYQKFLLAVMKSLKSEVRLLEGAPNVGVMGSSMGGLLSLSLALHSPDVFGNCAALSPSLLSRDAFRREAEEAGVEMEDVVAADELRAHIASMKKPEGLRIYLDAGIQEDLQKWTWMTYQQLVSKGFSDADCMFVTFPEGHHNNYSWGERVHLPLQFMFSGGLPAGSKLRAVAARR